jgi:hypothetical protein
MPKAYKQVCASIEVNPHQLTIMFRTARAGLLIALSAKPDVFVSSQSVEFACEDGATMSNPAKRVPLFEDDGFDGKTCEEKKAELSQLDEDGCFDARLNFEMDLAAWCGCDGAGTFWTIRFPLDQCVHLLFLIIILHNRTSCL